MTDPLDAWIDELAQALDLDAALVDRNAVLDLARDAAHGIARPAAPLTTFLAGLAAGRRGGSADDIAREIGVAQQLIAARQQTSSAPE
jgi:uncharacterized protein DUF6457